MARYRNPLLWRKLTNRFRLAGPIAVLLIGVCSLASLAEAASRSLFFPHLISGLGFETRLALTNPGSASAKVTLTARAGDGSLLSGRGIQNPATLTVPAHQQVWVRTGELFRLPPDSLHLGWIEAETDNTQLTALLFASTSAQQGGAGVEVGGDLRTSLVGPIPAELQTAVALVNPNPVPAQVTLRIFDSNGSERGQGSFSIPSRGHRAQFLNEATVGKLSPAEGGHFEITSTVGLSGLEVITGLSGYTLTPLVVPSSGPFVYPQVVNGPEASTRLVLQNTADFAVEARWMGFDRQGRALKGTDRDPLRVLVPAHGTLSRTVAELFGLDRSAAFDGSVQAELVPEASSALAPAQAAGLALFTQGSAVSSLPARTPSADLLLLTRSFAEKVSGTSFYVLNPGSADAELRVLSYGVNGEPLGSRTLTLSSRQPVALDDRLPAGAALIVLRASSGIVAYQLGVDSTGVWQSLSSRGVPPVVGGAAPISAELGGTVLATDARASVNVPMDALEQDTTITITSLTLETAPGAFSGMAVMAAFKVTPAGLRFRQPVVVEFPVLRSLRLPDETVLQIFDPQSGTYQRTSYTVRSGAGGTTLLVTLPEFPANPPGMVFVVLVPDLTQGVGGGGGGGGGAVVPPGTPGGVVTSNDGQVSVVIPPGALPTATSISVATLEPASLPPPPDSQNVLFAIKVEPSGVKFSSPVTLEFKVPTRLQGHLPKQLPLYIYNPLTAKYERTSFQAVLSADGTALTASVTHFTIFVVLQPFTPFASPILPLGTAVRPLGIASIFVPQEVVPPPTIGSFNPTSGLVGTSVTMTGTGFTGATAVKFNGIVAIFAVNSDAQITVAVPSSATTGPISVTTPGGTADTTSLVPPDFTVTAPTGNAPTIGLFSPGSGPGGTTVTITGANFTGASGVTFNGVPASSFTVNSATSITATVPGTATAPLTSTGPIAVTTPGGTAVTPTDFNVTIVVSSYTVPLLAFDQGTLLPTAGLTVLNPFTTNGYPSVGTLLPGAALTVSNPFTTGGSPTLGMLLPGAALTVSNPFTTGGTPVLGTLLPGAALTVANPSTATGAPNAGTLLPGAALVVKNAEAPPTISMFSPLSGTTVDETEVTITGKGFTTATDVAFNGVSASGLFTIVSDTSITTFVPSGATTGPITVTNPGGTASSAIPFVVPTSVPPTITDFTPASGPVGTVVTITGLGFTSPGTVTAVQFTNDASGTGLVTFLPAWQALTTYALGDIRRPITQNGHAYSVTGAGPSQSTEPAWPTASGATVVDGGVTWQEIGLTVRVISDTSLTVPVPAGAVTGPITVTTTSGGTSLPSAQPFVVTKTISGKTVSVYDPDQGVLLPTIGLTVLNPFTTPGYPSAGTLLPGAALTVSNPFTTGGIPSTGTLLPGAALTVLNPFTTGGVPNAGTLLPGAALTASNISFTPLSGPTGTTVTITGGGFRNGDGTSRVTSVEIAGQPATFTVNSNTSITATVSATATGSGPVKVFLTGGLTLITTTNFTVQ